MSTIAMAPVHPGEVLAEEYLAPLGVTQHKLAVAIGVPPGGSTRSCTAPDGSPQTPRCGWLATSGPRSGSG